MTLYNPIDTDRKTQHSILSFSNQATTAYRFFSKENFLDMMSEMSIGDIKSDLERFKNLEEYEICKKIEFVLEEKTKAEMIKVNVPAIHVNI